MRKYFILTLGILVSQCYGNAQCLPVIITSSTGYSVTVEVNVASIIAPSSDCQSGYEYQYSVSYNISFSGSNIPWGLYTLQGTIVDDNGTSFYDLPNNSSNGTVNSATLFSNTTNCASVTPGHFNPNLNIQIHGEGIPNQYMAVPGLCIPLPVSLMSFKGKAQNEGIFLHWKTSSEKNSDHFSIEKSADLLYWTEIGKVKSGGTTGTVREYSYFDLYPSTVNHYRLKQIDLDGRYAYSRIVSVNALSPIITSVYPNPATTSHVTVTVASSSLSDVTIILYDALGRIVEIHKISKDSLEVRYNILLPNKQIYRLHLIQNNTLIGAETIF